MKAYAGRFPFQEPENDSSFWGIIDVMTLMLVFFIVMYVQESPKVEEVAKSPAVAAVAVPRQGGSPEISQAVQRHLAGLLGNGFYVSSAGQGLTLVLEEQLSFGSGQAMLATDAVAILDRVAGLILEENGYDVVISGHTDDIPINNDFFSSNWHLSAARAVSVAEYLIRCGVAPERLTTQGFAEFRPMFSGDTSRNRAKNRRVEITLLKKDVL
ncbi:MAG: OmpA family protein [Desulfobulbaceae bacterium]|nr:OmpA family protein [Desulfobulbaceae bacterium]HIJ89772.1 OmpA family protein [Deltaproteobacteria bacterium]